MKEISLIDVWKLWFSGEETKDYILWGWKLLYWGRLGKIIQLISAFTIITDIVGVDRLQRFGDSMRNQFSLDVTIRYFRRLFGWLGKAFEHFEDSEKYTDYFDPSINGIRKSVLTLFNTLKRSTFGKLNFFISLCLLFQWIPIVKMLNEYQASLNGYNFFNFLSELINWIGVITGGFFINLLFFSPMLIAVVSSILAITVLAIDLLIIDPIAYLLRRKKLEKWISVISFGFLLIGFHFDLLSS